jgi:hypothetical protein
MANPVINLSYIGVGPTAGNQFIADQTSGPKSKTLYAYGNLVAQSSTFTSTTVATINFIDGVQTLGQTLVKQLYAVTAPATIGGVANQVVYSVLGGASQIQVGQSVLIAGFTNSGNNGTFTVNAISATTITVTNSSSVAETNYAATAIVTVSSVPVWVDVFVAGSVGDSTGAASSAGYIYPSGLTGTGFTIHYGSLQTTGASVGLGFILAFSS